MRGEMALWKSAMEHFYGSDWAAKLLSQVVVEAEDEDAGELPADALETFRAPLLEGEPAEDYEARCLRAGRLVLDARPADLTAEEETRGVGRTLCHGGE